jgi:hypothetical protein
MLCQLEEEFKLNVYPRIMKNKHCPLYLLFTSSTEAIVLYDENDPDSIGQLMSNLTESDYDFFLGKIILQND